jgi:predicted PurR-regulated permease PerM
MSGSKVFIHISAGAIIRVILVLLVLGFLYLIRDIVLIVFVSVILAAAISPWVDAMKRKKIPRPVGVLLIYIAFFALIALSISLLIPLITTQVNLLIDNFPVYYEKIVSGYAGLQKFLAKYHLEETVQKFLNTWTDYLGWTEPGIFAKLGGMIGKTIGFLAVLVLTFYMAVEKKAAHRFLRSIVPHGYRTYSVELLARLQKEMGAWFRGTLFRCLIIGALTFIGLSIVGINYALVLGLVAGILEIVPWFGPTVAAIPAIILAFIQSPVKALLVLILCVVIQQVESQIVTPYIMKKAVGLDPIVTIIVVLIGAKLAGILGALIAVPIAVIFIILVKEFIRLRKEKRRARARAT